MKDNLQTIGPVSSFEYSKLKEFFEQNRIDFTTEVDPALKAQADRQMELQGNGEYDVLTRRTTNTFDYNNAKFLFVSVPTSEAQRATTLLDQLNLSLQSNDQPVSEDSAEELLTAEDYMCLDCEHHSLTSGQCPQHKTELIPYFKWVELKKQKDSGSAGGRIYDLFFSYSLYGLIIAVLAFAIYKFTGR